MSDWFHRAITGQANTRKELLIGGALVVFWFLMDFVQWLDWLWSKL